MIERLFVPLDGSTEAESVLPWLRAWKRDTSKLILFHCLPARLPKGEMHGSSRFDTPEEASAYLEGISRAFPGESEIIVRTGFPGDRIVTVALQAEADLVVLGGGGEYGSPRRLGGVTEMVARTCPLPVLLVKTPVGTGHRRIRRILVPLDMNARGDENMEILRGIAGDLRAEVVLLHVGSPEPEGTEGPADGSPGSESQIQQMQQIWSFLKDSIAVSDVRLNLIHQVWAFLKKEIAARTVMTKGSFIEETLSHERSLDADIVAIARDGTGPGLPWNAIVRQSERAVLLYEYKDLNSSAMLPALRDRALSQS